jgi:hypothetical protein
MLSLEVYSQGFPLDRITIEDGIQYDYIMNYDIDTKMRSDTINSRVRVDYYLKLPYQIKQTLQDEYQLTLQPEGFYLEAKANKMSPVKITYDSLKKEKSEFYSQINISDQGEVLEYISNSENNSLNDVLKIINTYSTGIFLEFPIQDTIKWEVEKPIIIDNNGADLIYNSTYNYHLIGEETQDGEDFYRVNFELIKFNVDISDEMSALMNRLMENNLDLKGYYLIDKATGITHQLYTEGSIRTIFDISEFKALMSGDNSYRGGNIMQMQINFKGNSYLR